MEITKRVAMMQTANHTTARMSEVNTSTSHRVTYDAEYAAVTTELERLRKVESALRDLRRSAHALLALGYTHRQIRSMVGGAENYEDPCY